MEEIPLGEEGKKSNVKVYSALATPLVWCIKIAWCSAVFFISAMNVNFWFYPHMLLRASNLVFTGDPSPVKASDAWEVHPLAFPVGSR